MAPASRKEFLDIQTTIEFRITLKLVRDMIIISSHVKVELKTGANSLSTDS